MSEALIKALQNAALYPHAVQGFEVIQTHLSWVLLTGSYAYKIKKPLHLGFQDFSTLEKRKQYCELEVELNKRLAPEIYIEVITITGTDDSPTLAGDSTIIEYAVKMNQFGQENLLSNVLTKQGLNKNLLAQIAIQSAQFHMKAKQDSISEFGNPASVYAPIVDNFIALKSLAASKSYINAMTEIESWSMHAYATLEPLLTERKQKGFVRACHGDFHLGNMVIWQGKPIIFDCIEFNESFRWTDVMNDVCFLAMDLERNNLFGLSHFFVNKYFEQTFDYQGALLLDFYKTYRAMVRAKISALQLNQVPQDSAQGQQLTKDLKAFIDLGLQYAQPKKPSLCITYGLSGSGKSLYSERLLMQTGAIRLRADVIRKHLFGLDQQALYSPEATQKVYNLMHSLAKILLENGSSIIIDATFLKRWQRQLFIDLANSNSVPFTIYAVDAPLEILQQRIEMRAQLGNDPSDADNEVLTKQIAAIEPLTKDEKSFTISIETAEIDQLILSHLQSR